MRQRTVLSREAHPTTVRRSMIKVAMYLGVPLTVLLLSSCRIQSDEVARTASPSGAVDAVVLELNGGATTSYLYEVCLVPHGVACKDADTVVSLYGAGRSEIAYGINIRWVDSLHLNVEYMNAKRVTLRRSSAVVAGGTILVSLKSGVVDPAAPAGGMYYNLHRK